VATFVLIPGAGGDARYWSRLVPELERRGHRAIPVDISEDDPALGLPEYAAIAASAVPDSPDVVVVAQSLGGFTAPMLRTPMRMLVLLNAMIPSPGETPGAWWGNTGAVEARHAADAALGHGPEYDEQWHFLHDIPVDLQAAMVDGRGPSETPFGQPCEFERWPEVPIKVLVGRDDRFFPADFQRRVAKERLGLEAEELRGGHLVAMSNPVGLADRLVGYAAEPDASHSP
jgi:pimeloyl-ACP methyl ester carboxylesterase